MTILLRSLGLATLLVATTLAVAPQSQPASAPRTTQQPSEIGLAISGEPGAPPRYAVPDFLTSSTDPEVVELARMLGQTLWDDLAFEREFYLIPRDTYASIPAAGSVSDIPFDRWQELGADALVVGSIELDGDTLRVQARLFSVRARQTAFAKEYSGTARNPRLYAHTIADEIHQNQRALRGVARTKLTFSSDRDGERVSGPIDNRNVKEVYLADYDGANQRRVTVNRSLNVFPVWSTDGRSIIYTSYRRGYPDLFVSNIYQGTLEQPTRDQGHNWLSASSPDGTRVAFVSNRTGNPEIFVMNRDGRGVRQLTNHPMIDSTPTWSPTGNQIAFTSDRGGSPQIYVMSDEGLNLRRLTFESYCDRPTWSPAPYNEIAYSSRSGPGFDIKILDLATGEPRAVTFGRGSNESPSYSPNGRHLAFTSTRAGKSQIFTIGRDGRGLRRVTQVGNNYTPNWSN